MLMLVIIVNVTKFCKSCAIQRKAAMRLIFNKIYPSNLFKATFTRDRTNIIPDKYLCG